MMHSLVRGAIVSWCGSFAGKKRKKKRLGRLFGCVCFGLFGGRELRELLKIVKMWTRQLNIPSYISFGIGLECLLGIVPCQCWIL